MIRLFQIAGSAPSWIPLAKQRDRNARHRQRIPLIVHPLAAHDGAPGQHAGPKPGRGKSAMPRRDEPSPRRECRRSAGISVRSALKRRSGLTHCPRADFGQGERRYSSSDTIRTPLKIGSSAPTLTRRGLRSCNLPAPLKPDLHGHFVLDPLIEFEAVRSHGDKSVALDVSHLLLLP